ncbi:MAG: AbrB/MazE/SpoVT family DNA-binding domain-containing protein [Thermoleophilia bacterium]|nr:AbrB/MazE/SpoVT family DNA-binding domain-containing protein [Thermoleophilia bacterium]
MAKQNEKQEHGPEFYGSATVGERGQIVIPADARQKLDINPGDKLLIFSGMHGNSLNVMKSEQVAKFVSRTMQKLSRIGEIAREEEK